MKMQKRKFRIGELAKRLNVERFVIRFWEKEFQLKAVRSGGGQRFYEERDFKTFKQIKELLYNKGFTINGARQQLKQTNDSSEVFGSHITTIEHTETKQKITTPALTKKATTLKQKLLHLRKLL
ncbi:MerR family transcriptional regulator [bacterium]|nr:MerR family transcriptional regulator [bacterium]